MAEKQRMSGEVQVKCSPHKFLKMFKGMQHHIPNICSDKITSVEAHHDDWETAGTTRRWDYIVEGKPRFLTEKLESVDNAHSTVILTMVDGDIMKLYYKTFASIIEATPILHHPDLCMVKWTLEYEKFEEDGPEPQPELDLVLGMAIDIGEHHSTNVL